MPPASARTRMLELLEAQGVSEESIAAGLAQVVRGERVERMYARDKAGMMRLATVKKTRAPKDVAAGAILYDALRGGDLGLAPRVLKPTAPASELYARWAPKVDARIVQGYSVAEAAPSLSAPPPAEATEVSLPVNADSRAESPTSDGRQEEVLTSELLTPADVLSSIAQTHAEAFDEEEGLF